MRSLTVLNSQLQCTIFASVTMRAIGCVGMSDG
jgi:hypothetical protein